MGRFWIEDDFVRVKARDLTPSAFAVFVAISSTVNKDGKSFIGQRKIAEWLGMSKTTVNRAISELELYQLLVRSDKGRGNSYQITTSTVPIPDITVPIVGTQGMHKELIKEEVFNSYNAEAIQQIREKLFGKR